MTTLTIENASGEFAYDMTIRLLTAGGGFQHGEEHFVDRMFDKDGSETLDPTLCVEVETENELRKLRHGDKLLLELDVR